MMNAFEQDLSDVCIGGYVRIKNNETEEILEKATRQTLSNNETLQEIFSNKNKKKYLWELWDKLFKKNVWGDIRFKEDISMAEDMLATYMVLKRAKTVSYVPIHSYYYVQRDTSACHVVSSKHVEDHYKAVKCIYNDIKNNQTLEYLLRSYYLAALVSLMRKYLIDGIKGKFIKQGQKEIRNNLFYIISRQGISMRCRLGAIFFSLPYCVGEKIRYILRKKAEV